MKQINKNGSHSGHWADRGGSRLRASAAGPASHSSASRFTVGFTDPPGRQPPPCCRAPWPSPRPEVVCCPGPLGQPRAPPAAARCPHSPSGPRRAAACSRCCCPPRWGPLRGWVSAEPPPRSPSSSPALTQMEKFSKVVDIHRFGLPVSITHNRNVLKTQMQHNSHRRYLILCCICVLTTFRIWVIDTGSPNLWISCQLYWTRCKDPH